MSQRPLPTPPLPTPPPPPATGPTPGGSARCYRHPNRETGRRCTRCGKAACNECLVQASVGSNCLECAKAARPSVATRAKFWSAGEHLLVTKILILVNVAVFLGAFAYSGTDFLVGNRVTTAHQDLGLARVLLENSTYEFGLSGDARWLRLVTSGFMHYGVLHLAMNMYFLWVLGPLLEQPLGRGKYLALYVASLLGGSAGVVLLDSGGVTVGASGAVFGLLGAAAVGLWRQGVNPFSTSIGTVLLINLFLTFSFRGISIGGHLGGLVAGAICGYVLLAPGHRPFPNAVRWATPIAIGLGAVAVAVLTAT